MRSLTPPLVGALVLFASSAFAQSPVDCQLPPLADALQGPAKTAYSSGGLLYKNGNFAGAELKYKQAYDLAKDPRLLFNMAVCEKERHRYARMQELLSRYEEEAGSRLTAEDRARADAALAAIKDLVGTVKVTVNVPGAEVSADDEPVGTTPLSAPLAIDLGTHKISVRKDGFEPVTVTFEVQGGGSLDEPITLVEKAPPARPVAPDTEGATKRDVGASPGHALEWSLVVGGNAAGVGGVVLMAVSASNASSARSNHDKSAYDSAATMWTMGLVGAIAGGAAALGGGVFLLVPRRGGTGKREGSVWVGLEDSKLTLGGAW
jgi:hypothetical protein